MKKQQLDFDIALAIDIKNLPEVPSCEVLALLRTAAYALMDIKQIAVRGRQLQLEHGLDAVPPCSELECAAGFWDLIRMAIIEKRKTQPY